MIQFSKWMVKRQHLLWHRSICTDPRFQPGFDPYTYTKGRWLHRDKEQRDARRVRFDFDALLDVAVRCSSGARRVVHCEKKEGGFNRVFMIHLDNESTVVARLPTRIAGPPRLTVSSEVATLQFVKERTTVPVPRVLSWSSDPDNIIGAEYMILEALPGVPLNHVWNGMTASQHVACIRSIGRNCKQLCQLNFPAYGSLYLNSMSPSGAVRLDDNFCIGPITAPQHWGRGIDSAAKLSPPCGLQGPWDALEDYFNDLIARTRSSLQEGPEIAGQSQSQLLDAFHKSLNLVAKTEMVNASSDPILYHPDLHTRNIFVDSEDHTKITGIIDWQSAAVEPAFVFAAQIPDFAESIVDDNEPKDITPEEEAANAKTRLDADFCGKAWWVVQQACAKLRPASRLDDTLLRVLASPSFAWTDKKIILHTLLNDLSTRWEQIGLPGNSIVQPVDEDQLEQDLEDYQVTHRLQEHLTRLLRCDNDGWVSNDRWSVVLPQYQLEYSRFVESVIESEECSSEEEKTRAIEKANRLWPYDQR